MSTFPIPFESVMKFNFPRTLLTFLFGFSCIGSLDYICKQQASVPTPFQKWK